MMRTTVTLALLCVLGGSARANTFVKSVPLGATHTRPESITKAWGGKYYVSIQNTNDAAATDGEIVQVDLESGTVTPFVAAGTLRNPRGLAFTGDVLVVTDDDKLWKVTKTGQVSPLATSFPFPPV